MDETIPVSACRWRKLDTSESVSRPAWRSWTAEKRRWVVSFTVHVCWESREPCQWQPKVLNGQRYWVYLQSLSTCSRNWDRSAPLTLWINTRKNEFGALFKMMIFELIGGDCCWTMRTLSRTERAVGFMILQLKKRNKMIHTIGTFHNSIGTSFEWMLNHSFSNFRIPTRIWA